MDMVLDTAVKYNDIFMSGVKITIIISLLSCFFGLLLGIILAFMKISGIKVLQWISTAYVEVIRGTPVLVQISLVFFGLPFLGIHFPSFQIMGVDFERLSAGVLALILNSGAYECEIVRSGIQSIPKGQYEGAKVLGFTYRQTMWHIVLPQVVKRVIPPLGNETITLLKDTSLVYILAMNDLMRVTRAFVQRDFDTMPFLVAAVFYLVCTAILTKILTYVEKRYAVYEE